MEPKDPSVEKAKACRTKIIKIMKKGGYFDKVLSSGSKLNRVKKFLTGFDSSISGFPSTINKENPAVPNPRLIPMFPGIKNIPLRSDCLEQQKKVLEANAEIIRNEALSLDMKLNYFEYGIRDMAKGSWHIHLFSYMGSNIDENCQLCPETSRILNSLTQRCQIYPWGDAIFSVLEPGAHIPAHCSVDNLRVRCMLGLVIPEGCSMRVGNTMTTWQEGKVLFFEDSYEHEVWHKGKSRRIVLILDFWHPELTDIEISAITAGLAHPEIRDVLYQFLGNDTEKYNEILDKKLKNKEAAKNFYQFWNAEERHVC